MKYIIKILKQIIELLDSTIQTKTSLQIKYFLEYKKNEDLQKLNDELENEIIKTKRISDEKVKKIRTNYIKTIKDNDKLKNDLKLTIKEYNKLERKIRNGNSKKN